MAESNDDSTTSTDNEETAQPSITLRRRSLVMRRASIGEMLRVSSCEMFHKIFTKKDMRSDTYSTSTTTLSSVYSMHDWSTDHIDDPTFHLFALLHEHSRINDIDDAYFETHKSDENENEYIPISNCATKDEDDMKVYASPLEHSRINDMNMDDVDDDDATVRIRNTASTFEQRRRTKMLLHKVQRIITNDPEVLTVPTDIRHYRNSFFYDENELKKDVEPSLLYGINWFNSLPLHWSSFQGQYDIVELIMNAYPSALASINGEGSTPLHYACSQGHYEIVKLFLDVESNGPRRQNNYGNLPLHEAVINGHPRIIKLLLETYPDGASVADDRGRLAIHRAVWKHDRSDNSNVQIINMLMDVYPQGASIKDHMGRVPIDIASDNGESDIAELLVEKAGFDHLWEGCEESSEEQL